MSLQSWGSPLQIVPWMCQGGSGGSDGDIPAPGQLHQATSSPWVPRAEQCKPWCSPGADKAPAPSSLRQGAWAALIKEPLIRALT